MSGTLAASIFHTFPWGTVIVLVIRHEHNGVPTGPEVPVQLTVEELSFHRITLLNCKFPCEKNVPKSKEKLKVKICFMGYELIDVTVYSFKYVHKTNKNLRK